jgi:hypothetical protein
MDSAPDSTIGHRHHQRFIALLQEAQVTALADVRSAPVALFAAFQQRCLAASLAAQGIDYVSGKELGGVRTAGDVYARRADYEKMAASPEFRVGLARLTEQRSSTGSR